MEVMLEVEPRRNLPICNLSRPSTSSDKQSHSLPYLGCRVLRSAEEERPVITTKIVDRSLNGAVDRSTGVCRKPVEARV